MDEFVYRWRSVYKSVCIVLNGITLGADIVIGMDLLLNQKIQKRHFFQDIQNSF